MVVTSELATAKVVIETLYAVVGGREPHYQLGSIKVSFCVDHGRFSRPFSVFLTGLSDNTLWRHCVGTRPEQALCCLMLWSIMTPYWHPFSNPIREVSTLLYSLLCHTASRCILCNNREAMSPLIPAACRTWEHGKEYSFVPSLHSTGLVLLLLQHGSVSEAVCPSSSTINHDEIRNCTRYSSAPQMLPLLLYILVAQR